MFANMPSCNGVTGRNFSYSWIWTPWLLRFCSNIFKDLLSFICGGSLGSILGFWTQNSVIASTVAHCMMVLTDRAMSAALRRADSLIASMLSRPNSKMVELARTASTSTFANVATFSRIALAVGVHAKAVEEESVFCERISLTSRLGGVAMGEGSR